MLGLLAGFSWFNSPRFMGAQGNQVSSWIQHDYIGKRRIWFAISGAVVLVALGSLAVKELNLGIDFEGGTKITFATPQARDVQEVRDQAARIGAADAQIQGNGAEVSAASASSSCGPSRCLPPSSTGSPTVSSSGWASIARQSTSRTCRPASGARSP